MAKLNYKVTNGGATIEAEEEPQILDVADLGSVLAGLLAFQTLPDDARALLAQGGVPGAAIPGGFPDLESFDAFLDADVDRLRDLLDLPGYETKQITKNVADGDWFLPEALELPHPDNDGNPAANAIDNAGGGDPNDPLNTSYWQSTAPGERVLILRLRGYSKRVEGIRLRTNSGDGRAQLQALEVRAANSLSMIDDPGNVVASAVDVDDAANWFEIEFVKIKCQYVKLVASTSAHSNPDHLRIRSVQVRVGVTNHDK